ncbi:2,3-dihydroxybenzoate-AMP ligase, partial [Escherichia coli]|nr:2,3-dihydroxybenzoate-AMP ligase [Escherichia coli]
HHRHQHRPPPYSPPRRSSDLGLSACKIPDKIEFLHHWPPPAVGNIQKKRLTALAVDHYRHSAQ